MAHCNEKYLNLQSACLFDEINENRMHTRNLILMQILFRWILRMEHSRLLHLLLKP